MYQLKPLEDQYDQIKHSQKKKQEPREEKFEILKKEIDQLFKNKQEEINNCIVKIFFLGAINSGKSTLINSIVGQSILPTGNQSQENFVTLINNDQSINMYKLVLNDDDEILSNDPLQIRKYLNEGGEVTCQFKEQLRILETQLFDIPGLSFNDDQRNQELIDRITDQCDENTIPIFVMVINQNQEYKIVIELLEKISSQIKNKTILDSFKSFIEELRSEISLEQKNTAMVINKYDQKGFEVREQINMIQFNSIFRISALYSFYNSVFQDPKHINYQQLIQEFLFMHRAEFNLQNEEQAKQFINAKILNNQQQSYIYDFDLFLNQLNLIIKYEYNRKQFNETHHQLQSKLCVLDHLQQGVNFEENIHFIIQVKNIYEQIEENMYNLIKGQYQQYQGKILKEREEYYFQFIKKLNNPDNHQLKKELTIYYDESMQFLLQQRKTLDDYYQNFIKESVQSLTQLLGPVQTSFELISLSSLNLVQQLQLIISKVQEILLINEDIDDVIKQLESLQNKVGLTDSAKNAKNTISAIFSFIGKVSGRIGKFSELLESTFMKIKNEQIVDLRVIKENVHFTERNIIRNMIEKKNSYIFALQQIMKGCNTFISNLQK